MCKDHRSADFAVQNHRAWPRQLWFASLVSLPLACAGTGQSGDASAEASSSASERATDTTAATPAAVSATTSDAAQSTASNGNTAKTPVPLVVPSLTAQSPNVQAMHASGAAVTTAYVVYQDSAASATSTMTGTNKQFEIIALDYDPCPFYYAHAQTASGVYNYKVAPTSPFNFAGLYLINGSVGAALTAGTYAVGATSGLQIVTDSHTSGINFDVTACRIGDFQGFSSGTVTVDALSSDGKHTPVAGRFDLVTTDGGSLSGPFVVGHCTSGNTAYPLAPTPDPNACTL